MKEAVIAVVNNHIYNQQLSLNLLQHELSYFFQYRASTEIECLISWANERITALQEEIQTVEGVLAEAQKQLKWLESLPEEPTID